MTTQQVDPLRECNEAKEKLEEATSALNSTGELLVRLGQGLQTDPVGVRLANTDLPRPIDLPDDFTVDYGAIPSREDLKNGLQKYYETRSAYQAALRKLPPNEQELFVGSAAPRLTGRTRVFRQPRV